MASPSRPNFVHAHFSSTTNGNLSYNSEPARYNPPPTTFSAGKFLLQCLITPILGFGFVAFGFYILYGSSPVVISQSTAHISDISQGLTVLLVLWNFVALAPALSVSDTVKNEEWWRRLVHGTTFNRANSVSSNIGGNFSHAKEMLLSWTSRYYKVAWAAAFIAAMLADIAPSAIHVQSGWKTSGTAISLSVPALPANSIWSDYSAPFSFTNDTQHSSIDLAPLYYGAVVLSGMLPDVMPNVLLPRPNASESTGYRYTTDVVFLNYSCEWRAPEVAEPDPSINYSPTTAISFSVGGINGTGSPPFAINDVYPLQSFTDSVSGQPSFAGYLAFVASSGASPPGQLPAYLNLSEVPNYTPSPAWEAVSSAWRGNLSFAYTPVTAISVAICTPNYTMEAWEIDLANGTLQGIERQRSLVRNLDPTQVQIAITDAFNNLASTPPFNAWYPSVSTAQLATLFQFPTDEATLGPLSPKSAANITDWMNFIAIPSSVQAYFDQSPFGSVISPDSKVLVPALILTAQLEFMCIVAALYTLLTVALLYMFWRPHAKSLDIQTVLEITRDSQSPRFTSAVSGRAAALMIENAAPSEFVDAKRATVITSSVGSYSAMLFPDQKNHAVLEICPPEHDRSVSAVLDGLEGHRLRGFWTFTPMIGAGLVGLGIVGYVRPHNVGSFDPSRATLYATLFTWAMGVWRSCALIAISALIRQGNSDEWSRLLNKRSTGLSKNLRSRINKLSSNSLSIVDAFLAAWMTRTSIIFKICYMAALLASLCAVVAQAMVSLVPLPAFTEDRLDISLLEASYQLGLPWSADATLAPGVYYFSQIGKFGTSLSYLEQVAGIKVSDTVPPGYIVPRLNNTNLAGSPGFQYPTDAIRIQCNCSWVAPILPNATNASYISVGLESFDIIGVQTVPHGIATFAPVSNLTYLNSTAVTSGLFAWTLWGGGPGDPINLDSIPYANLSSAWQNTIMSEIVPEYLNTFPGDRLYITNLTRASTLVCDPGVHTVPVIATAYNGAIQIEPTNSSTPIGNIVGDLATYLIFNFATQQALTILGIFRPYLLFGLATGNAVFDSDPANPINGVVPKPLLEIASHLDAQITSGSKAWTRPGGPNGTMTVNGKVIQSSLIMVAGLPWILASALLFFVLGCMGLVITRRRLAAPFTLAGILMMSSQLEAIQFDISGGQKDDAKVDDVDEADSE